MSKKKKNEVKKLSKKELRAKAKAEKKAAAKKAEEERIKAEQEKKKAQIAAEAALKAKKKAKKKAALPIVTRSSDFRYASADAARLFALECRARDLYSLSLPETDICGREMTDKLLRI